MYINWDEPFYFNLHTLQPDAHGIPLPSYGEYGGPGNSGPGPAVDLLDGAFKTHDEHYGSDPVAADVALIDRF